VIVGNDQRERFDEDLTPSMASLETIENVQFLHAERRRYHQVDYVSCWSSSKRWGVSRPTVCRTAPSP